jgi:hypothetical protein
MIELVFAACLVAEVDRCQTHSLLFQDISMMTCMVQGQARLAEWSEAYPGWQIKKWRCQWHKVSRVET